MRFARPIGMEVVIDPVQNGPASAPVVLVVEDEVLIRLATSDELRDIGFEVVEAANADEAMRYLRTSRVDAVLTDVRMPGTMDGLELARIVRKQYPDVAVFIVSGHVGVEAAPPGVAMLGKPYDALAVGRLIRKALED